MAQGRWKASGEQIASEAYAVLIQRHKASRTYTKAVLIELLKAPANYTPFLKLCLEFDDSQDCAILRKGLLIVVQARGVSGLSRTTGLSRLSLYRMLSHRGNPRLKSLIGLLKAFGLHLWVVDRDFINSRTRVKRPKIDRESYRLPPPPPIEFRKRQQR